MCENLYAYIGFIHWEVKQMKAFGDWILFLGGAKHNIHYIFYIIFIVNLNCYLKVDGSWLPLLEFSGLLAAAAGFLVGGGGVPGRRWKGFL